MIPARYAKIMLPPAISLLLLAGVIWWVSPAKLAAAAATLNWPLLVPVTALMVLGLYLWDALCLPAVYRVEGGRISFWQALHLRGLTYLGGSLNYELGQAALAWGMARLQGASLVNMLARSVLLAYHDILVLLFAGGLGALLTDDERVVGLRPFIATGLAVALAIGILVWILPARWLTRLRSADKSLLLAGWSLARSVRLVPLRVGYFAILVVYATVALAICKIPVDWQVALSTVPLVLLADGLPSFASLGSRETVLHLVLAPGESNPTLVAMSLMWSIGMVVVRLLIATVHLWLHRTRMGANFFGAVGSHEDLFAARKKKTDGDDEMRLTA
jgi:hypothetical protein